jgi:hypothetical protein
MGSLHGYGELMFGPLLPFLITIMLVLLAWISLIGVGLLLDKVAPKYARVYFVFPFLAFAVVVVECLKKKH